MCNNWLLCCLCQVIEALFHVAAHTFSVVDTIYLMSHYTTGGILFGDRTELPRHSLPKVICCMCFVWFVLFVRGDGVWWVWEMEVYTHYLHTVKHGLRINQVFITNNYKIEIMHYFILVPRSKCAHQEKSPH